MTQPGPRDRNLEPTIQQQVKIASSVVDEPSKPSGVESAVPFRPLFRPPTALVCVVHDHGQGGDWHTVRSDSFRFGRTEGDVLISHDSQISGLHCELVRRLEDGVWRWSLRDLGSRNGTFLKLAHARLSHNMHLLLGCHRYRFEVAAAGLSGPPQSVTGDNATSGWQLPQPGDLDKLLPAMVRLTPGGDGERFTVRGEDQIIGTDSANSQLVLPGDRMLSPRHARLWQDDQTRWTIEDLKSHNGTWVAIEDQLLDRESIVFQIGEQRVMVRFPK